jgi:cytochrome bd ubiquinol oxidase subunit I
MATFGDVFGLAFGLEGFSFFIEAIFIAIYVYGWDRLPRRTHFLTGIPIIIAGITGSMFVIAVNAWMNDPRGFQIVAGKVTDVHPFSALFGGHLWFELTHMYFAGYIVAGFLIASVYSFAWLRGKRDRYHRIALIVALAVVAVSAPAQLLVGDWAARTVAKDQPVKLAAFEGLDKTTKGAPLNLLGYYNKKTGEVESGINFPDLLSILAFHDPDSTVKGLDTVPQDDQPPVDVVRYSFQFMVLIGTFLAAVAAFFAVVWWRKGRLPGTVWFYRAVVVCAPLSLIALICGWITTEVGRQPWVVYQVMRTEQAVTGADGIPVGYGLLALTYVVLFSLAAVVLRRIARHPIEIEKAT